MKLLRRFSFPLVSIFIVFLISVLAVSSIPQIAKADAITGGDKQAGIASLAERWLWYRAIAGCYSAHDVGKNSIDKIDAGTWFDRSLGGDTRTAVGYLDGSDDGKVSCGDGIQITRGLKSIGFTDNKEAFCSMSVASRATGGCMTGSGEFDMSGSKNDQFNAFLAAVQTKIPASLTFPYPTSSEQTKSVLYWVGLRSLKTFCGGKDQGIFNPSQGGDVGDSARNVVVNTVDLGTGKIEQHVYKLSRDASDLINDVWAEKGGGGGGVINQTVNSKDLTCQQLAQLTWSNDDAFSSFVKRYNAANPDDAGQEGEHAGEDGAEGDGSTTSCALDGVGWIVCPIVTFLGKMNDLAFGFINNFLEIRPALFNDSQTRLAWEAFRNIANVAFVIAFMIIIYSQLTGLGINNYGIKRLLPKLIIAAILVNISFWICAILVDLSNIVGSSLYSLLKTDIVPNSGFGVESPGISEELANIWSGAIAFALGTAISVALIVLILMSPMAILAFALVIFILIARQALVLMLIVVSPLAFVAYLLPNTEDWFKKWWKALSATLMVFPIIAFVFGMSYLAAKILMRIAEDGAGTGGDDEQMLKIIAAGVLAVPLFAVPALLKGSLSAVGTIGARITGLADKAQGAGTKAVKRRAENWESLAANNERTNRLGRMGRFAGGFRTRRDFRHKSLESETARGQEEALARHVMANPRGQFNERQRAQAIETKAKRGREEIEAIETLFHSQTDPRDAIPTASRELSAAVIEGDGIKARAMQKVLLNSGSKGLEELNSTISTLESGGHFTGAAGSHQAEMSESLRHDINSANLTGKDGVLAQWAYKGGSTMSGLTADPTTFEGLTELEAAGQTLKNLSTWEGTGPVTPRSRDLAKRVVAQHKRGTIQLTQDKLDVFERMAR